MSSLEGQLVIFFLSSLFLSLRGGSKDVEGKNCGYKKYGGENPFLNDN